LGCTELKTGPCGGVDLLQNEKKKQSVHRGAGNVEAHASTATERRIDRTLSGVVRDERT
jgi:hypothetical protein